MALSVAQMGRMSRLLDEALPLDGEGRQRWLQALPSEHQDLAQALERALLPQTAPTGASVLRTLPELDLTQSTRVVTTLKGGDRVGPYQLVRLLGAGGMAEVWQAQRADGAYQREVALKLPMLSRLRKDLASRFARERDILAALEHPNIARLYDAGVTGEGLPYLAMEYVHGEPLTAWCDAHQQGVRERLSLFLQILDAVQYAHAQHVIHRDLKPSNILVTDAGQVRLLDFGVAKLLAHEDDRTELTQIYGRALTPEYASPELVRGDAIEAASDIYSLGVVLFELLSGSRPYRLKAGATVGVLEQAIAAAHVERPSTHVTREAAATRGTTPQKLARRLKGDLDSIVLKALAKEAGERYRSAAELADEVQRYLSGQPVEAHPDRLPYRLSKFALRHRTGVAMSAAAALLFGAMSYELIRRESSTAARAPTAQSASNVQPEGPGVAAAIADDKSIAVLPFVDMSEKKDQEYFSDGLAEELIDNLSRNPDLKVIARTSCFFFKGKQATIGEIARTLGASHVLEGSVRKQGRRLRVTTQLIRALDGSHLWSQTYERTLDDIFRVQDEITEKVAAAMKVALNAQSRRADSRRPTSEAYNLLLQGNYFANRDTKEGMAKAINLYEQAIKVDPSFALAWAKLSFAYQRQADNGWRPIADAISVARAAVDRAVRIDPNVAFAQRERGALARDYEWDWKAAQAAYQRANELEPTDLHARADLAFLTGAMFGRFDESIADIREIVARDPLDMDALLKLAWLQANAGQLEESLATFHQLLAINPVYAGGQTSLGLNLLLLGRKEEALIEADKESDEAYRLSGLPSVYWALGRKSDSDAALATFQQKYAAVGAYNLGQMHAYRGEVNEAIEWLDRAYRQHDGGMVWIKVDPFLRSLHDDPRYQALLAKMRLTDGGVRLGA